MTNPNHTHLGAPSLVNEAPRKRIPTLIHKHLGTTLGRYKLSIDSFMIGRGDDVNLNLTSNAVSRHHASISHRDGEFTLTDLNSTHGVILNGIRIHQADLRDGDVLQLADVILIYEEG